MEKNMIARVINEPKSISRHKIFPETACPTSHKLMRNIEKNLFSAFDTNLY